MTTSLVETNPFLRDPGQRRKGLARSIVSSSAIEGIFLSEHELLAWFGSKTAERQSARSGQ